MVKQVLDKEVEKGHDFYNLKGSDNIVLLQTDILNNP